MSRWISGISILLLSISAVAENFDITKKGGRLFLNDPYCKDGPAIMSSLKEWSANSGLNTLNCQIPVKLGRTQCRHDITSCVPQHVVKYHLSHPENNGPNCWNLALVMKGIIPSMRYTSPEEMAFYMRPPLCQVIAANEKPKAGDIGAIRTAEHSKLKSELHGFIYISDKVAYSKNGLSRQAPYALQSLDHVYKEYGVPQDGTSVDFFRCISFKEYLEKNNHIPAEIIKNFNLLSQYERCLERQTLARQTLPRSFQKNLTDVAMVLTHYLKTAPESSNLKSDERTFLQASLQLRLQRMTDQLMYNEQEPPGVLETLMTKYRDSKEY